MVGFGREWLVTQRMKIVRLTSYGIAAMEDQQV